MAVTYSLVIPIHNEEATIPEMYRRLNSVMDEMDGSAEVIFVDDGSRDTSLQMLRDLNRRDHRIGYLSLARNFGHQIAVTAGLNFARGQAIVVMDGDLQDPPELLLEMAKRWREGYQVIYAQRSQRLQERRFKRLCAYLFYRLLRRLSDVDIPTDAGDFCLMDRKVVDVLNNMPERNRYIRGLRSWIGFRQTAVRFDRDPRFAGEAKYPFIKSLALAMNGVVSFSKMPLRIATYVGLFASALALTMSVLVLYWRLFTPHSPLVGFAAIATIIFFLAAVQLLTIGILGEYIGHIHEEVKARPLYTLKEVCGFYSESLIHVTEVPKLPEGDFQLQEREYFFELVNDSVMTRTMEGRINFWSHGAEALYGWRKEEALGRVSHDLLQTRFPKPLKEIESELVLNRRWEGRLVHTTRDGRCVIVESRWALELNGQAGTVIEINMRPTDCEIDPEKRH